MGLQKLGLLDLGLELELCQRELHMGQKTKGATLIGNLDTKKTLVRIYMGSPLIGNQDRILKIMATKSRPIK